MGALVHLTSLHGCGAVVRVVGLKSGRKYTLNIPSFDQSTAMISLFAAMLTSTLVGAVRDRRTSTSGPQLGRLEVAVARTSVSNTELRINDSPFRDVTRSHHPTSEISHRSVTPQLTALTGNRNWNVPWSFRHLRPLPAQACVFISWNSSVC